MSVIQVSFWGGLHVKHAGRGGGGVRDICPQLCHISITVFLQWHMQCGGALCGQGSNTLPRHLFCDTGFGNTAQQSDSRTAPLCTVLVFVSQCVHLLRPLWVVGVAEPSAAAS